VWFGSVAKCGSHRLLGEPLDEERFQAIVLDESAMYEKHWGLQRTPFGSDGSAESYFASSSHQCALLKLRFLVEHHRSVGLLVGQTGVGKTRLLEALLATSEPKPPVVRIVYPLMSPIELLRYIGSELGLVQQASTLVSMDGILKSLVEGMRTLTGVGRPPLIVIDDAHTITDRQVWQSLQLLLNFQQYQGVEFSLILSGPPELAGIVKRMPHLDDRVSIPCVLTAMTDVETAGYIQHRLQAAGAREPIFSPAALRVIHELSNGLPRRINRLCDFALLVGFAEDLRLIDAEQIEGVSAELNLARAA
jgi:MSHA biogenesis protein MshM